MPRLYGLFSVPGFVDQDMEQVSLYHLYQLMHRYSLRFITLQPSRKLDSVTGQATGSLSAYTCTHHNTCFAVEFDFDMAAEHKWLLEELIVRTQAEPKPIPWKKKLDLKISSVLEQPIIDQVVNGFSCFLDHSIAPQVGRNLPCKGGSSISLQNNFKWRFVSENKETLSHNWLYAGAGYRILPLQSCQGESDKNIWQCPSHLVWSQGALSWSGFAERVPVLSIRRDVNPSNYQARYFDYDFLGIGAFYRNVNHAEKLLKYLVSLPASLNSIIGGYAQEFGNEVVPYQQDRRLVQLINIVTRSSLFYNAERHPLSLKKDMDPISVPIETPVGKEGAVRVEESRRGDVSCWRSASDSCSR